MHIYIDGDACPVKDEVYKVAARYAVKVSLVSNSPIRVPPGDIVTAVVVRGGFDAADDWIVERVEPGDIVITSDIPLAERCLVKSARVIGPKGHEFTEETIGDAMATRALMDMLRQGGAMAGGPSPFNKSDRSRFLSKLDEVIQSLRRKQGRSERNG